MDGVINEARRPKKEAVQRMAGPAVRFEDGLAPAPLKGTNRPSPLRASPGVIFVGRVYRVKLPSGRSMPAKVSG